MEYYKLLNFAIEPFSNSPDPRLFYNSRQHLEVLQKLEISIRLKRGLNVVIGDIGTGKTTVSRQLIQELSKDQGIKYHLILDPGFSSVHGFLTYILELLIPENQEKGLDENSLKENIKAHLFTQGIDENINTVLVIDEGQKLSMESLELLRELLNFETNDQKLLQIVIFAQNEFEESLEQVKNFQDRINFRYHLTFLNFKESKGLIQYRMNKSFAQGKQCPVFTKAAFIAIYWATKGSPRKMVTLCHQVILALITKKRKKASFFLVKSCAKKIMPGKKNKRTLILSALIFFAAIILADFFLAEGYYSDYFIKKPQKPSLVTGSAVKKIAGEDSQLKTIPLKNKIPTLIKPILSDKKKPAPLETKTPAPKISADKTLSTHSKKGPQNIYGSTLVPANATVYRMINLVYGEFSPDLLNQVMAYNSSISAPGKVLSGLPIHFPVPEETKKISDNSVFLLIFQTQDFNRAFTVAASPRYNDLDVRILPFQGQDKGYFFNVVLDQAFKNQEEANVFLENIEPGISAVPKNVVSLKTKTLMDKG